MAKYIDVEPLMNGGWQLQRYNSGNGYVNQEHASLKDIPPADVRPVRRGEWKSENTDALTLSDVRTCSVCGLKKVFITNFCPSCGADMRGGDADGDEED